MTSMLSTCSPRHWQTQVCTDCFRLKLTIVFLTFIACFFLLYSPHFPRLLVVYSARFWCIERRYLFSTTPPWIIIIFFILKKLMPIYLITKYCLDDIILDLWYSRHSCLFKELFLSWIWRGGNISALVLASFPLQLRTPSLHALSPLGKTKQSVQMSQPVCLLVRSWWKKELNRAFGPHHYFWLGSGGPAAALL